MFVEFQTFQFRVRLCEPRKSSAVQNLVTGGNGFIGSHLCSALARQGNEVTSFSRTDKFAYEAGGSEQSLKGSIKVVLGDIRDREPLASLARESEIIFHKAALVGVAHSALRVKDFVDVNVQGTANLVEILKTSNHSVSKVILGSSISVYGEGCYHCASCGSVRPALRMSEDDLLAPGHWNPPCPKCGGNLSPTWISESDERKGESVYAISKRTQEDLLSSVCKQLGISLFILRYTSVYGPGMSRYNPYSKFIDMMLAGYCPQITEDRRWNADS